jgi:hypothetical protein
MSFSLMVHCDVVMDAGASICARYEVLAGTQLPGAVALAKSRGWTFDAGARCPAHSITLHPQQPRDRHEKPRPDPRPDNVTPFRPRPS